MPVHNSEIADVFDRLADLLEIDGANPFRIRAYRNAAQTVSGLPRPVADMLEQGEDLTDLPGVGKDLAGKIETIVRSGRLPLLAEIEQRVPPELGELMKLSGLGAKRVKALHEELGISSLSELAAAARNGQLGELPGFGQKMAENILDQIAKKEQTGKRLKLATVVEIAEALADYLREAKGVKQVTLAGSYRRRRETVGDLDILVTCKKDAPVMDRFTEYDEVDQVVSHGKTRGTVVLRSGVQVDLRVVPEVSYGAALHYFTGSKAHNIAVRKMGVKRKLKINEYGVFRGKKRVAGRTEREVYKQIRLPYIEPELRENRGEIEAAQQGKLPKLITLEDIRGDLHAHTTATDGHNTLGQMAEAARQHGYHYLAITDHTKNIAMVNGLDEKRLRRQIRQIDRANEKLKGIRVLKGTEVDILEDGSLDLKDDVLEQLDIVVASIHTKFNLSRSKQTERVLRAMDNPNLNIVAHPTGRLILKREPYEIDLERVMEAALQRGCYLELNAQPDRLDLSDAHCKLAKEMGLKLAISTDAHHTTDLEFMQFGIGQARRGWLEADDVLNTRSWRELKKLLKRS